MMNAIRTLSAAALLATVAPALPVMAEDQPHADTIVATVNGTDITLGHMIVIRAGLPAQYAQMPDDVLFEGILDQLIQQTVLEQSYEGELTTRAQKALENERRAIIAGEVLDGVVSGAITEGALKKAYDEKYGNAEPETEYRAAHILVETEQEAKDIVQMLADGAEFAALAKEKSTGPSGPNVGDLGWFSKGMMVPPFGEAAIALDPGQISAPVQTQFGWHVIKLEETRQMDAPTLDEVRQELEDEVRMAAVDAHIASLTDGADVTRPETAIDPALLKNLDLLEN